MQAVITFIDEHIGGVLHTLEVETDVVIHTLRDVIALRVAEEVRRYNAQEPTSPYGFAVSETEAQLNGKRRTLKPEDAEKQTYIAFDAFLKHRYFVIVNDTQVENLDARVVLGPRATVSFFRLTQLVGG